MATFKEVMKTNYNSKMYSVKELQAVRRQLAKTANQRMVRLEQHTSSVTGESYTWGAHEIAQKYLKKKGRRGREGQLRYNEKSTALKTKKSLQAEINELQAFLRARTSRYGEQKKIEEMRIKKFESGEWAKRPAENEGEEDTYNGTKLHFASTKQFYDFLSSDLFKNLSSALTSEQVVELYDAASVKEEGDQDKVVKIMEKAYKDFQKKEVGQGQLTIRQMEDLFGVRIT